MKNGIYEVTKFIHTFSCTDGHLRIPEGTRIVINRERAIIDNSIKFPSRLLNTVQDSLKRID